MITINFYKWNIRLKFENVDEKKNRRKLICGDQSTSISQAFRTKVKTHPSIQSDGATLHFCFASAQNQSSKI